MQTSDFTLMTSSTLASETYYNVAIAPESSTNQESMQKIKNNSQDHYISLAAISRVQLFCFPKTSLSISPN